MEQRGRVLKGTFVSPKATENFLAVIGPDDKSIACVDENGMMDLNIADRDTPRVVYRQVTDRDMVIPVGTWKRKW